LLEQVKTSSESDAARAERFAKQFSKVNERGIDRMIDRMRTVQIDNPEVRKKVQKLVKHDADRVETILNILEKSPNLTKSELRKAVDAVHKRHKSKKNA
jgi:hypothetical protein